MENQQQTVPEIMRMVAAALRRGAGQQDLATLSGKFHPSYEPNTPSLTRIEGYNSIAQVLSRQAEARGEDLRFPPEHQEACRKVLDGLIKNPPMGVLYTRSWEEIVNA